MIGNVRKTDLIALKTFGFRLFFVADGWIRVLCAGVGGGGGDGGVEAVDNEEPLLILFGSPITEPYLNQQWENANTRERVRDCHRKERE